MESWKKIKRSGNYHRRIAKVRDEIMQRAHEPHHRRGIFPSAPKPPIVLMRTTLVNNNLFVNTLSTQPSTSSTISTSIIHENIDNSSIDLLGVYLLLFLCRRI